MKSLLICPNLRPSVSALAEAAPLSNVPLFGKSLLEYWLEHLVLLGAKEVLVIACDRVEQVRELVGNGARWGISAQVIEENRELNPSQSRLKYRLTHQTDWLAEPNDAALLDHFPGFPPTPLFTSYADLFTGLQLWLPHAKNSFHIGLREIHPGVWAGLHTHISPDAKLQAPCWLGDNVWIGAKAIVGPMAILENRVCVEQGAEISDSVIGSDTFVGAMTEVKNSFASGSNLINWKTGAFVKVPDAFVLSALRSPRKNQPGALTEAVRAMFADSKEDVQTFVKHLLQRG